MTPPDDRLAALFAQDLPPARDPAFSAAVLEAVARKRFQQDLAMVTLASLAAVAALAILGPVLAPAVQALTKDLGPVALALSGTILVVWLASRRPDADLRLG